MKIGDSVRVYETNDRFYEGKIICIISQDEIHVDWEEWRSCYTIDELELEYREGKWSWRPLHEGKIIS